MARIQPALLWKTWLVAALLVPINGFAPHSTRPTCRPITAASASVSDDERPRPAPAALASPLPRRRVLGAAATAPAAIWALMRHPQSAAAGLFGDSRAELIQARVDKLGATRKRELATVVRGLEVKESAKDALDGGSALRYSRTYFAPLADELGSLADFVGGGAKGGKPAAADAEKALQQQLQRAADAARAATGAIDTAAVAGDRAAARAAAVDLDGALGDALGACARSGLAAPPRADARDQFEAQTFEEARAAYFGPFACEFFGQKRIPGSNNCLAVGAELPPAKK